LHRHSQNATPVQPEDQNGKTATVQDDTDPVEVQQKIPRQPLSMQHAEGWRISIDVSSVKTSIATSLLTIDEIMLVALMAIKK
jgi:hypothetical protein